MAQIVNGIIMHPESTTSLKYRRKHENQSRNFIAATFLLMGAGTIMYSFFYFTMDSIHINLKQKGSLFFSGVIVSVIISAILLKKLRKVMFYYAASIMLIVCGGLFLAYDYITFFDDINFDIMYAAAFFAGASLGISLLTFIVHCGEISVKYLRASIMSNAQLALDTGLLLGSVILSFIPTFNFGVNQMNPINIFGIILIIFGILALITTFIFVYESPIFLLEAGNEQEALHNLIKLRKEPNNSSYEVQNEMQEIRKILANNSYVNNSLPFLKLVICRIAYTLATSTIINEFLTYIALVALDLNYKLIFVIFIGRFVTSFLVVFVIDIVGRKLLFIISFVGSGVFLIIINLVEGNPPYTGSAVGFIVGFFIFLGLGGSSVTHTYMTEVFTHPTKTYLNAIIITIECAIQIIVLNFRVEIAPNFDGYLYFTAALNICVGICAVLLLPETKGKTLLEAQAEMRKLITFRR